MEKEEKETQEEEMAVTASADAEKMDSSTENHALRNDSVIRDKTRNMSHDSRLDSFMCDKTRRTSHDSSTETKAGALGMADGASENKLMLCQGRGGRASERESARGRASSCGIESSEPYEVHTRADSENGDSENDVNSCCGTKEVGGRRVLQLAVESKDSILHEYCTRPSSDVTLDFDHADGGTGERGTGGASEEECPPTNADTCKHSHANTDTCTLPHLDEDGGTLPRDQGTLQNTATICNTLQRTATHSNAQPTPHTSKLQQSATHCNALQRVAMHCNTQPTPYTAPQISTNADSQTHLLDSNGQVLGRSTGKGGGILALGRDQGAQLHTAAHCSTLQHTATHCNTLQHTATHFQLFTLTEEPFLH